MKTVAVLIGVIFLCLATAGCLVGGPAYNVWSKKMKGQAAYAEAQENRRIKVLEATAEKDSATLIGEANVIKAQQAAKAEIERAKGTAEANKIVQDGLGGPEGYLRYLYINALAESKENKTIYVPTEAGLPILEAGKR